MSNLVKSVTCPYCWEKFPPFDVLWISESPELYGDPLLQPSDPIRFLPSRYDENGKAVDARGISCSRIACPFCHLPIPVSLLTSLPCFISIAGAPASGKSYFLASMTSTLRKLLPDKFCINFSDADLEMNMTLIEYETEQFTKSDIDEYVKIKKTQANAGISVQYADQRQPTLRLPPYIFNLSSFGEDSAERSVSLCLYDNAGESYAPNRNADSILNPLTRHLGVSDAVFFLFDPMQDNWFQRQSLTRNAEQSMELRERQAKIPQQAFFEELIHRIRENRHMKPKEKLNIPFVIVLTKLDEWKHLIPEFDFCVKTRYVVNGVRRLRMDLVRQASRLLRTILYKNIPGIVTMAEAFADEVIFIPVSATGISPGYDSVRKSSGFRPKDINPLWIEIPILYALSRVTKGRIIGTVEK